MAVKVAPRRSDIIELIALSAQRHVLQLIVKITTFEGKAKAIFHFFLLTVASAAPSHVAYQVTAASGEASRGCRAQDIFIANGQERKRGAS